MAVANLLLGLGMLSMAVPIERLPQDSVQDLPTVLLTVEASLEQMADCLHRHPNKRLEDRLDELYQRQARAVGNFEEVWGHVETNEPPVQIAFNGACNTKRIEAQLASATASLTLFYEKLRQALKPRKQGLWVGNLHLCRTTVKEAEILPNAAFGQDALAIKLNPRAAEAWEALTGRAANVRLNISLDGTSIARPNVNEANSTGQLWIAGPPSATLVRAREVAMDACWASILGHPHGAVKTES
ncbi:MAG: hypothetical protein BVN32_13415 [Proteobacteria bacterium ST_bin14]|nr:MAG: hypothetical protein BVN32_13415 [Proteobacteria bacterium ST_bin14]